MEAPPRLPGSRRDLARHLARGLGVCALSLALLGPVAAPAGAATGTGVVFTVGGVAAGSIPGAELEARTGNNLYSSSYVLRASPGEAGQIITRPGMPVARALSQAGIGPYGYLTIPRPDGTTAYLPAVDFAEPSPFEGGKPALFTVDSGVTRFFRPVTSDPSSVNAEDNISTVGGEPLLVGVHQGSVLTVKASASPASTDIGTAIRFEAAAEDGPGGSLAFEWSFGDGTTAAGEAVSHAFAAAGTYEVRVSAVGSDGSGGESGPLNVVVGTPPTTEGPGATTTPEAKAEESRPAGASGKGHGGRGGKGSHQGPGGNASKSGSGAKKKNHSRNPIPQSGNEPATRSHPSQPTTPATTPPSEPFAVPAPTPEESSGGDSPEPPRCCSAEAPPEDSPPPTPEGELVEGRLVGDDLGPASIEEAAASSPSGEGSRSAAGVVGDGGFGVPAIALSVAGLLAAGALFEWRRRRPGL